MNTLLILLPFAFLVLSVVSGQGPPCSTANGKTKCSFHEKMNGRMPGAGGTFPYSGNMAGGAKNGGGFHGHMKTGGSSSGFGGSSSGAGGSSSGVGGLSSGAGSSSSGAGGAGSGMAGAAKPSTPGASSMSSSFGESSNTGAGSFSAKTAFSGGM